VFELTLNKPEMLIGRADIDEHGMPQIPDLDLTDADSERLSSRCHARLTLVGGAVYIEDLGSANGTYLEGEGKLAAHQSRPLPPNARAMFGRGGPVLRCRV
jgi:pSer/pThr/pTyr-binding forkhead associated (FHA) protein